MDARRFRLGLMVWLFLNVVNGCASAPPEEARLWLAWGDSYTIGEGVMEDDRWPAQVVSEQPGWRLEYTARTGWTTGDLLLALRSRNYQTARSDRVSILIGVNNQYRGLPLYLFEQELERLVVEAIRVSRWGGKGVVLLTIPDYGVTPFGRRFPGRTENLESFNQVIRKTAQRLGTMLVDITPISSRASEEPELTSQDGLHPSGPQYRLWAREVRRLISFGEPK